MTSKIIVLVLLVSAATAGRLPNGSRRLGGIRGQEGQGIQGGQNSSNRQNGIGQDQQRNEGEAQPLGQPTFWGNGRAFNWRGRDQGGNRNVDGLIGERGFRLENGLQREFTRQDEEDENQNGDMEAQGQNGQNRESGNQVGRTQARGFWWPAWNENRQRSGNQEGQRTENGARGGFGENRQGGQEGNQGRFGRGFWGNVQEGNQGEGRGLGRQGGQEGNQGGFGLGFWGNVQEGNQGGGRGFGRQGSRFGGLGRGLGEDTQERNQNEQQGGRGAGTNRQGGQGANQDQEGQQDSEFRGFRFGGNGFGRFGSRW